MGTPANEEVCRVDLFINKIKNICRCRSEHLDRGDKSNYILVTLIKGRGNKYDNVTHKVNFHSCRWPKYKETAWQNQSAEVALLKSRNLFMLLISWPSEGVREDVD